MATPRHLAESLKYPFRAVLFQYRDKPGAWHVCCVDNGACGWGPNPDKAFDELALTLVGQIRETFASGQNFFFQEPSDEWVAAFEKGLAPTEDVRLVARAVGTLTISPQSPKARPRMHVELRHTGAQLEPV